MINIHYLPSDPIYSLALGIFDGVHRGHQALISLSDYVLTLSPHPDILLKKSKQIALLSTPSEFKYLVPNSAFLEFTKPISELTAEQFLNQVILSYFNPRQLIVGYDYRFGHKGEGTLEYLEKWGRKNNVVIRLISAQKWNGRVVKSSCIRDYLRKGDLAGAVDFIGRSYYFMLGTVERGDNRGKSLGFPTANVFFERYKLLPQKGVYYGTTIIDKRRYTALINIGVAPTFKRNLTKVELHILDYDGILYGKTLPIYLTGYLREERVFSSIEFLKRQIAKDVATVRLLVS